MLSGDDAIHLSYNSHLFIAGSPGLLTCIVDLILFGPILFLTTYG